MSKNEAEKDFMLLTFLNEKRKYSCNWNLKKTNNSYIQQILNSTSKRNTGYRGEPDLIYINENKRLLILIENKDSIKDHESKERNKPALFAVDGIIHYLSFFKKESINKLNSNLITYFEGFIIVGLAISGDINDEYKHNISTFVLDNNEIKELDYKDVLDEDDYVNYFSNIDMETIIKDISESSKRINHCLRNIDSQERPILLSALMICLFEEDTNDFFREYKRWSIETIINSIPLTIEKILKKEGIPLDKIQVLKDKLSFINSDIDLNNTDILIQILDELKDKVVPLFCKKSNYDIIGKFYEEFLRYAGVSNVKKGIVLTPHHITKLFTELIDIKVNDVFFDPCCGTGAFLIAGMNSLIDTISNSSMENQNEKILNVKKKQLIGFEKHPTMYTLSISNMLFRGDGKSQIHYVDFFSKEADDILEQLRIGNNSPTIGFINPPYGGKDNKDKPTKKEIQFLTKMLDNVSRYGIIIAPLSTYFKDDDLRNKILTKHTLKYVINMPSDLFQPNASTNTAIAVFETHLPHNNKEVIFYDLRDDGFVLSKNKGRTDVYNRWSNIKTDLVKKLKYPEKYVDEITLVKTKIKNNDEWLIQAHSKTDYSLLSENSFVNTIKKYISFKIRKNLNTLDKKVDDITIAEILISYFGKDGFVNSSSEISYEKIDVSEWKEFSILNLFGENNIIRGRRLIESDRSSGNVEYYSASGDNNGLTDTISNPLFVERNALIYTTFGDCYYIEGEFTASDEISIFKHKNLNIYNGLFIVSVLNESKYKYQFGRKAFFNKFKDEIIKLPADSKGDPDWFYMENYIRMLPYSDKV